MLGQRIHAGTNDCELLIDEVKLFNQLTAEEDEESGDIDNIDDKNIDELFDNSGEYVEGCEDEDFNFTIGNL
jgi:hypothetical protein